MRLLLVVLLAGCNVPAASPTAAAAPPPDPHALALHARLFAAADGGDVAAFKALLTPRSVQLVDGLIARMAAMPRPKGEAAFEWASVLRLHAKLPADARLRAPYPVAAEHLDLAAHPDARFFTEIAAP